MMVTAAILVVLMTSSITSGALISRGQVDQQQVMTELRDTYSPMRYHESTFSAYNDDRMQPIDRAAIKSGLTAQQIQQIVDRHNALRRNEGASNMEVLKWNPQLAVLGQQWADRCAFEHGQPSFSESQVGYRQLGQNLYASSDPAKSVADGVQAWFDEKTDYTYDTLGCRPNKACGHYTQVVWGSSRDVGCGLTNCSSISSLTMANYLVCNYGPPGNWQGQKPFLKGAACSACDSGKFFCSNQLCDYSCNSPGTGSSCKCEAKCGRCGTVTNDCKCLCKPGWSGVSCSEECKDKNPNCGGNPGWPSAWCDSAHQFVLDNCPKLCKKCAAGTGAGVCAAKSSDSTESFNNDVNANKDDSYYSDGDKDETDKDEHINIDNRRRRHDNDISVVTGIRHNGDDRVIPGTRHHNDDDSDDDDRMIKKVRHHNDDSDDSDDRVVKISRHHNDDESDDDDRMIKTVRHHNDDSDDSDDRVVKISRHHNDDDSDSDDDDRMKKNARYDNDDSNDSDDRVVTGTRHHNDDDSEDNDRMTNNARHHNDDSDDSDDRVVKIAHHKADKDEHSDESAAKKIRHNDDSRYKLRRLDTIIEKLNRVIRP